MCSYTTFIHLFQCTFCILSKLIILFRGVYPSNVEPIFVTPHFHFAKINRPNPYSVDCSTCFSSLQIISASFQVEFTFFEKRDVHLDKLSVRSANIAVIFHIPTGMQTSFDKTLDIKHISVLSIKALQQ